MIQGLRRRGLTSLAALLLMLNGSHALAAADFAATSPITSQAIGDLLQVGDPQISPDGRRIAYTIGTPYSGDTHPASRIWLVNATGSAPAQELETPQASASASVSAAVQDWSPIWSADGKRLLFLSDRPATGEAVGAVQVWSVAADGSDPRQLTHSALGIAGFALSRDGRQLAFRATDPLPADVQARRAAGDDAIEQDRPLQFTRLWVQDLASGAARQISPPGLQVQDAVWTADGRALVLRVSSDTTLNGYWYDSRIVLMKLDGSLKGGFSEHASAAALQLSPDGKRLLYGELSPVGMTHTLYVQPLSGGLRTALASDWLGTLWAAHWQDDHHLVGEGLQGVRGAFLSIDASNGHWKLLADPQLPYPAFSVAGNGRVAYLGSAADTPDEVWTLAAGKTAQRTHTNPQVAQWPLGRLREIHWTSSRDGLGMDGVLVTPKAWDGKTPLPTLIQIHGGPAEAWASGWLGSWHNWAQMLSSHGYAVFMPNQRGSEGHGTAFTHSMRGDWGTGDLQDVLDALDLLQAQGVTDPQRVVIGGWSYGGYLSAWAASHTDRFRAAIVGAGVTDIGAMALTTDVPAYLPGYYGDPVSSRAEYDAHSPIRYVDHIHMPVLILHGEADARVPLFQGEMLYRALRFHGTPVEMVRYPNGPHWFTARDPGIDVQQRVLDWLDRQIGPAAPKP